MKPLTPLAELSPSDVARARRAFTSPERDVAEEAGREVVTRGDTVVLCENGRETVVAQPTRDGVPGQPTLSADGTRLATVRTTANGCTHVEVTHAETGLLGGVRRLLSSSVIGVGPDILAADLSDDGGEIALLTSDATLHISPTLGSSHARNAYLALPEIDGVKQHGRDIEYLADGRLAIETTTGAWLVTDGQTMSPVPLSVVVPGGAQTWCRQATQRLPGLTETQVRALVDRFGSAATAASSSPDGQVVLVQVRTTGERVRNHLLEPRSGRETVLGDSPANAPEWPLGGREVSIPDGPSARLADVFPGWDFDLGQEALQRRQQEVGTITHDGGFVIVNGIRIPRRDANL